MKRLLIVMVVLGVVGAFGTWSADALTQLTPITGSSTVGSGPRVDVYEVKCPSGAVSLEVIVTDTDEDGDHFHAMLTGLSPAAAYGKTVSEFASYNFPARVRLSRSAPGAIKALLYVRFEQGFSALYDYEFNCLGVGGVNKPGSINQMQNELAP